MTDEEPNFILGRAFAAWANPPRWGVFGCVDNCTREEAEEMFTGFISDVCRNWGLTIVRLGVLEEKEK